VRENLGVSFQTNWVIESEHLEGWAWEAAKQDEELGVATSNFLKTE